MKQNVRQHITLHKTVEVMKMKNIENTENIICNTDSFLEAELAAEKHEAELISAMASYLGDDD